MLTTLGNWASGKRIDEATREHAALAKKMWPDLDPAQKDSFMARFKATKNNKNLGWVRNFSESLVKKKQARKETIEKHFTRHYTDFTKNTANPRKSMARL
jgi:hypothetical protein